jgi:drug/metabolite transporter (DMT)-like permease
MHHTPSPTRAARRWRLWLALATVDLVWGSTYLAIRVMVEMIPPLLGSGARFLLAGAVLYPFLLARRVGASALVGSLFLAGGTGLVTVAERDVPSGLAAVLVATGFAGVAVLLLPGNPAPEAGWFGLAIIMVANLSMAVASFASSRLPVPDDTLAGAALVVGSVAVVVRHETRAEPEPETVP